MNRYELNIPIFDHIGDPNKASIILLMSLGYTEEEAKEKIKNGWKPYIDDEESEQMKDQEKIAIIQTITIVVQIITLILQIVLLILLIIR